MKVRMYRQGHGDCFLLAMPKADGTPFYVLIDCGFKEGSEVKEDQTIDRVIADIAEATGRRLDVVLVTHEHEDHVNGFAAKAADGKPCFDPFSIGHLWLAWTEDGSDDLANELRERFDDTLIALMGADQRLRLAGHGEQAEQRTLLRSLLAAETGEKAADDLRDRLARIARKEPALGLRNQAALAVKGITNKQAIKYLRDKVPGEPVFLRPDRGPYAFTGLGGLRVFALGPPRDAKLLLSLNPKGDEKFHIALDGPTRSFSVAATADASPEQARCFDPRFGIAPKDLRKRNSRTVAEFIKSAYGGSRDEARLERAVRDFFSESYGARKSAPHGWRQIDEDWLEGSEALALRLNNEVNNTSLVIAIELPQTRKVLLFTGDAQRGNWISWAKLAWPVGNGQSVTARELLGRTVFYKVGHHGSHNATLNGTLDHDYANLAWLAQEGDFRDEFVAMIPAHEEWALQQTPKPWKHPLKEIAEALARKARGRVFRTDRDKVQKPQDVSAAEWKKFKDRVVETSMYLEYTVLDA